MLKARCTVCNGRMNDDEGLPIPSKCSCGNGHIYRVGEYVISSFLETSCNGGKWEAFPAKHHSPLICKKCGLGK